MNKKEKLNLLNDFSRIFDFEEELKERTIPEDKRKGYTDEGSVIMIVPKLYTVKKIIENTFNVKPTKIPYLNYKIDMVAGSDDKLKVFARLRGEKTETLENNSKYSPKLLKTLLKIATHTKSANVEMKFRRDYPLWIETDELICIIAPKITN